MSRLLTCVPPSFRGCRVVLSFVLYLLLVYALYYLSFFGLWYLGIPSGIFSVSL